MSKVAVSLGCVFSVLLPLAGPAHAALPTGEIPTLTLEQALSYAAAHEPRIVRALADLRASESAARVPRAAWIPQVGATAQLLYGTSNNTSASYLNVRGVELPRIGGSHATGSTDWSPDPSTLVGASLGQQIYDFGRIAAETASADALAGAARADLESTRLNVQLAVEEAYHAVLAAHQILRATDEAYARAKTHRDYARAGSRSGLLPPIDLTRAQAEVADFAVRQIRAQSGLDAARAELAGAVGSSALEIDAAPIAPGSADAPAFRQALQIAAQHNPAIAAALAQLHAKQAETRAISRELLPDLFASAGISGRAGGAPTGSPGPYGGGWLPDVANFYVGAVLQWNLFDATVLARRSAAAAQAEAAAAKVALTRIDVSVGTERAYLDFDAAKRALPSLAEAVGAARANQAQAEARFKAGLGTIVELTDAEALLTNAELGLAIGQFAAERTRAELGRMLGEVQMASSSDKKNTP